MRPLAHVYFLWVKVKSERIVSAARDFSKSLLKIYLKTFCLIV
ncbi:hypothetical protein MUY_003212 [Bacillus licheniformis WX-02]|nr:hypothetical protein MUY_003212 [Bacillus licheniformis WX-02]